MLWCSCNTPKYYLLEMYLKGINYMKEQLPVSCQDSFKHPYYYEAQNCCNDTGVCYCKDVIYIVILPCSEGEGYTVLAFVCFRGSVCLFVRNNFSVSVFSATTHHSGLKLDHILPVGMLYGGIHF